jgi:hypothetical protein
VIAVENGLGAAAVVAVAGGAAAVLPDVVGAGAELPVLDGALHAAQMMAIPAVKVSETIRRIVVPLLRTTSP